MDRLGTTSFDLSTAEGKLPLLLLSCPVAVIQKMRKRGLHDGFQRSRPWLPDARLERAFGARVALTERDLLLAEWSSDVDREAVVMNGAIPTMWCPGLRQEHVKYVNRRFAGRLFAISARTEDECLHEVRCLPWLLGAFYHIGCIGGWREIAEAHFKLMAAAGLTGIRVVVLGSRSDVTAVHEMATRHKVAIKVVFHHTDVRLYEYPAIRCIAEWAARHDGYVLYFHTKGAGDPGSPLKRDWRELMDAHVIVRWRENLALLRHDHDIVGVNWRDEHRALRGKTAHFTGNFWLARTSYIRQLKSLDEYVLTDEYRRGVSQHLRLPAEFWIGSSRKRPRVFSHVSKNEEIASAVYWRRHADALEQARGASATPSP